MRAVLRVSIQPTERHISLWKTGTSLRSSIILGRYTTLAILRILLYSPPCGLLLTSLPSRELHCLTSSRWQFSAFEVSPEGDFTLEEATRSIVVTFILCWNSFTWQMTTENFPVLLRSTANRKHYKRLWWWFFWKLGRIIKLCFPLFPLTPAVVTYAQHLTWPQLKQLPI